MRRIKRPNKPCIGLSNQATLLTEGSPQPSKDDLLGRFILRNYAPTTSAYGFHYMRYNNSIYTPIIRDEIRELECSNDGHYTVYLPAYDDKSIIKMLRKFPHADWEVFSKHTNRKYYKKNVLVRPIANAPFMKSFASCAGIVCAAGFGTTTEALYLGKKLLAVPQKSRFEQQCNAIALKPLGVSVMKSLKTRHTPSLSHWLEHGEAIHLNYPDIANELVTDIVSAHVLKQDTGELRTLNGAQYYQRPA